MPHWFQQTLVALDLETTGLDPLQDRIVQAAVVYVAADGSSSGKGWDGIVDPGVPIPTGASDIHGITTERARSVGVAPREALGLIAGLIDDAARDGVPLVIYNALFDWPFVLAEARRHGVDFEQPEIVDPLVLDRAMDRYRRGSRRLEDVAVHYGHDLTNAHDARADAIAAVAVARAIGAAYPEVGDVTPADLRPLQVRWFTDWTEGLAEHLGEPVDAGWPLPRNAGHLA